MTASKPVARASAWLRVSLRLNLQPKSIRGMASGTIAEVTMSCMPGRPAGRATDSLRKGSSERFPITMPRA